MPRKGLKRTNPRSFWETSIYTIWTMPAYCKGVIGWHGGADVNDNGRLLLQLRCNNTLCIINTFFQHRDVECGQVGLHLVQRFFGSTDAHWFLRSLSWLVPFSVGRSCQNGCRTVDRSPPAGLQLNCIWKSCRGLHKRAGPRDPTE